MKKHILSFILLFAFSGSVFAEGLKPVPLESVMDVLNIDLNDDGLIDRVVMHDVDQSAAVKFYFRNEEDNTLTHAATLTESAWSGEMAGAFPSLGRNDAGSVLVRSENYAMGHNLWEQILTIAYYDNAMRVIGYTYNWRASSDKSENGSCDINFLSQKARSKAEDEDAKTLSFNKAADTVEGWTEDSTSDICFPYQ
jgi:hypothetical protein